MKRLHISSRELKIARIRREIELLLHSSLREEEWEDLVEESYVEELLDNSISPSEVAEKVRRRRQVYGQNKGRRGKVSKVPSEETEGPSERIKALSLLVAQEAAKEEEVRAFRVLELGDELLPLEAVEEWIQKKAEVDGPKTWWLSEIPVLDESIDPLLATFMEMGMFDKKEYPLGFEIKCVPNRDELLFQFLKYRIPGTDEQKEIPTAISGTLERLRWLSEELSKEYGWAEDEATLFVLTGTVPRISPLINTIQHRELPALSRIVLTVDPSLSPREVSEHYRKIRQEVMGDRFRDLSEKHIHLAIFDAERPKDETWAVKMAEWNKIHPEWAYRDIEVANFSHDSLQARRRLLRLEKE